MVAVCHLGFFGEVVRPPAKTHSCWLCPVKLSLLWSAWQYWSYKCLNFCRSWLTVLLWAKNFHFCRCDSTFSGTPFTHPQNTHPCADITRFYPRLIGPQRTRRVLSFLAEGYYVMFGLWYEPSVCRFKYSHSYNGRRIGTRMWSIEWCHFQWSSMTPT